MRYLSILSGAVCLALMSLPSCAPEPEPEGAPEPVFDRAAEEAAIRKVFAEFKDAYNRHDAESIPAFFLNETMVLWTDAWKGKETIEKRYITIFERNEEIRAELVDDFGILFFSPNVALWRGSPEYTGGNDADGKPRPSWKNRGALVMVKNEGQWRIAAMLERPIEE